MNGLSISNYGKIPFGDVNKMLTWPIFNSSPKKPSPIPEELEANTISWWDSDRKGDALLFLTNEMGSDGNFEHDTNQDGLGDGWIGKNVSNLQMINNEQKFTAHYIWGGINRDVTNLDAGVYYFKSKVKSSVVNARMAIHDNVGGWNIINHSGSGEYEVLSTLAVIGEPETATFTIQDSRSENWDEIAVEKIHIIKVSDTLSGTKNELDLIFEFVDYLESGLVKVNPNNQIYLKDWSNNSFHQKLVNYSYTPNSGFLGTIPDALKSDGIDDWRFEHVQDGLVSVDASFSYCAMFKPSSNKIVRLVRGNSDSINGTICFLISLGNDYSYIRVNDVIREKPLELSTDIFTSIIITCSLENDLIVYINGTLLDIHGAPNTLPAMPYVQHSMSGETYTSESIAMEAFFNKALSQIEVENLHTILAQRFNE